MKLTVVFTAYICSVVYWAHNSVYLLVSRLRDCVYKANTRVVVVLLEEESIKQFPSALWRGVRQLYLRFRGAETTDVVTCDGRSLSRVFLHETGVVCVLLTLKIV